jgi:hypothetical protein
MKDKVVGLEKIERPDYDNVKPIRSWRVFALGAEGQLVDEVYYFSFNEAVATMIAWCLA